MTSIRSRSILSVLALITVVIASVSGPAPVAGADVLAAGEYHAVAATRIVDTRTGAGGISGPVAQGATIGVQLTGNGGLPSTGVDSVVLNVTVTGANAASFLTVWPAGSSRPTASNVNFTAGDTVPNLVTVRVGTGGAVSIFNNTGSVHVIVDVFGYYGTTAATEGARFRPILPDRAVDTRDPGFSALPPGGVFTLTESASAPVAALLLNVTVTAPTTSGYLTVYDGDGARPNVSNLNFKPGQDVANAVLVTQGSNGVKFYNSSGYTHIVVDVVGYFTTRAADGARYVSLASPTRVVDTRSGVGGKTGGFSPNQSFFPTIGGTNGISGAAFAVVGNLTVTDTSSSGFMTLWPSGVSQPAASSINWSPGRTVANATTVALGSDNKIGMFSNAWTSSILDITGYFA